MEKMRIGRETILNLESVEYRWIESLAYDGLEQQEINAVIQRCLGGDADIADMLRRIALKQCPPNVLLEHLNKVETHR
ncbi:hypothetical protein ACFFLZ_12820 [Photobacterium aphoticum]|uniref:Uncharacterized protein n=1 Tax=Photobacterium aphoticum TaxID=754436 RepID=A0A090QS58_9GAMM|nr:hypothetical protein [Photobacterium aphoticum]KLV02314.1 hypothetical protein ABT58_03990 [Photobacterium aphoticum]PSU56295.1 hypothetical protein C9I90_13315 [Photobacterium aphoticum]GAL04674.1 hypothetical protein JCM19237_1346 [Photobacterium aphoticum]GHA55517.1 hypothetical protein GCM10007086_32060 [Photobacterium aphoticum]